MVSNFEDLCTRVFVVMNNIWKTMAPFCKWPGPKPECTIASWSPWTWLERVTMGVWKPRRWVVGKNTASVSKHSCSKWIQLATTQSDASHQLCRKITLRDEHGLLNKTIPGPDQADCVEYISIRMVDENITPNMGQHIRFFCNFPYLAVPSPTGLNLYLYTRLGPHTEYRKGANNN